MPATPAELMVAAQELIKKMPLAFMLVLALASFGLILVLSQLTTTPSGKGAHFGGWSSCAAIAKGSGIPLLLWPSSAELRTDRVAPPLLPTSLPLCRRQQPQLAVQGRP